MLRLPTRPRRAAGSRRAPATRWPKALRSSGLPARARGPAQVRELEEEVEALQAGRAHRAALMALMEKKALVGDLFNQLRLARAPGAAPAGA